MEVARDEPWVLDGMSRAELCGTKPAVAEETQGGGLSRCALGAGLFASKAPSSSVPLPLRVRRMGLAMERGPPEFPWVLEWDISGGSGGTGWTVGS